MRWLLLLLACPGSTPEATEEPVVRIVAPEDGATVSAAEVEVQIEVEGFALVAPTARRQPPTRWLIPAAWAHDASDAPQGYVVLTVDGTEVASGAAETFAVGPLEPGTHSLEAELRWPDGDAFYPPVSDAISLTAAD